MTASPRSWSHRNLWHAVLPPQQWSLRVRIPKSPKQNHNARRSLHRCNAKKIYNKYYKDEHKTYTVQNKKKSWKMVYKEVPRIQFPYLSHLSIAHRRIGCVVLNATLYLGSSKHLELWEINNYYVHREKRWYYFKHEQNVLEVLNALISWTLPGGVVHPVTVDCAAASHGSMRRLRMWASITARNRD